MFLQRVYEIKKQPDNLYFNWSVIHKNHRQRSMKNMKEGIQNIYYMYFMEVPSPLLFVVTAATCLCRSVVSWNGASIHSAIIAHVHSHVISHQLSCWCDPLRADLFRSPPSQRLIQRFPVYSVRHDNIIKRV